MPDHEHDKVWSRWGEFLNRVRNLRVSEHEMPPEVRAFLQQTEDRLVRYEKHTTLSVKQRNWLTHIEAEFLERK